jgi:hypothetical protein
VLYTEKTYITGGRKTAHFGAVMAIVGWHLIVPEMPTWAMMLLGLGLAGCRPARKAASAAV